MRNCKAYRLEHLQTRDGNSLRSPVDSSILGALVAPLRASSGVQQNTDHEQVDQAAAFLSAIHILPCGQQVGDSISAAHAEVLVSAVCGNGSEGGVIIPL